jgi:hypothetical protein
MTQHLETVPASWTTADEDFFRTTWDAFPSEFLAGAGVLLASYDDDAVPATLLVLPSAPERTTVDVPAHA